MMKYDIAKNEEGPLRRTTNAPATDIKGQEKAKDARSDARTDGQESVTTEIYTALDERLRNLETHLAVRYGRFSVHTSH